MISGPFFLPEIPAPRGVLARSAAGAGGAKALGIGHFRGRSRLHSPLGLQVGAAPALAKSNPYTRRFIVNHGQPPRH